PRRRSSWRSVRALAATAIALLVLPAGARAGHVAPPPPPVVAVAVSNPSISPNGDGVRDRTKIDVAVDSKATLTAGVYDLRGALAASLASALPVGPVREELIWNGRGPAGRP